MLKKRIIPVQLLLDDRLVKTVNFDQYRDVGDPVQSSKVYSHQDADELIFLNIKRSERSIQPLVGLLDRLAEVCFMPLALGGGIQSVGDAEALIKSGADKVVINSATYRELALLTRIADKFGTQAVVASIDVRREERGYALYSNCGRTREPVALDEHISRVVEHGAGEIFVNSIDRDGSMSGYDIELIALAMRYAAVPVIACGGAGNYEHMREAFCATSVSALACGSLFNFGDNNPLRAKAFLSNYQLPFKVI